MTNPRDPQDPYTGPGSLGNPRPWVNGETQPTGGSMPPDPVHRQVPAPPGLSVWAHLLGWVGAIAFLVAFVVLFATDHDAGRNWGLVVPGIALLGIALTMGWRPFRSRR